MRYTVVVEPTYEPDHPGWYHVGIPALDLTTRGEGVDGAIAAAKALAGCSIADLRAQGRPRQASLTEEQFRNL